MGLSKKKLSSVLVVLLAISLIFSACFTKAPSESGASSTSDKATSSDAIDGAGDGKLSDEELKNSTFNPIYMGSGVDYKGDPIEIVTGENGAVQNKVLLDHQSQFEERQFIKIADNVYNSVSYGMANVTFIIGPDGVIVVDTNENIELATQQLTELRKLTDKPVKAIIYTHGHYINGTAGFLSELTDEEKKNVEIWAHEKHFEILMSICSDIQPAYFQRLMLHHGVFMPAEGEDGFAGGGLGNYYVDHSIEKPTGGYMPPTNMISNNGNTEVNIAGVNIIFEPKVADAADNVTVYLPDEKICINNFAWPNFANLYTLRGESYRNPQIWIEGIDSIIDFEPEYLLGVHGLPIIGKDVIKEQLTDYRDGIQYVYDETIKGINAGLSADEIVDNFYMPEKYVTGNITTETYGEIEYNIRGIYGGILGWYGHDPIELHPVSQTFEAERIVEGFGGIDKVIETAKTSLENKEYSWAAQLVTYVLSIDENHAEARQLKADALRKMAQVTPATSTRYFYLANALDLEGKMSIKDIAVPVDPGLSSVMPTGTFVESFRLNADARKTEDANIKIAIEFTDKEATHGLHIRNGIVEYLPEISDPDVTFKMTFKDWCEKIVTNQMNLSQGVEEGTITTDGDAALIEKVLDIFS